MVMVVFGVVGAVWHRSVIELDAIQLDLNRLCAEPATWSLTQSGVSSKTGTYIGLVAYGNAKATFDDLVVKKFITDVPSTTMGQKRRNRN